LDHKNVAMRPRFKMRKIHLSAFTFLRKSVGKYLPRSHKHWLKQFLFTSKDTNALREHEFNAAMNYFTADIAKLSVLVKRDLSSWYEMGKSKT